MGMRVRVVPGMDSSEGGRGRGDQDCAFGRVKGRNTVAKDSIPSDADDDPSTWRPHDASITHKGGRVSW